VLAEGDRLDAIVGLVTSFRPARVLEAGCRTGSLAAALAAYGIDVVRVERVTTSNSATDSTAAVTVVRGDVARIQLEGRFDLAVLTGELLDDLSPAERHLTIHNLAAHLHRSGRLVCMIDSPVDAVLTTYEASCRACGLDPSEPALGNPAAHVVGQAAPAVVVSRRVDRVTVHDLVAEARQSITRLTPQVLVEKLTFGNPPLVLDTRTPSDRARDGIIPGSIHTPRTTLEWRADPASGYADPAITSFDRELIVICNEGYSSSLAAASLRRLGFTRAGDLIGGFKAWKQAGLPVSPPDETHIG
jgi:rhodanese-related sulfurtransferase